MFFPYRAKIELHRVPVLTILVSVLCIGVFAAQSSNRRALHEAASEYCEHEQGRGFLQALRRVAGSDDPRTCTMLMLTLANSKAEKAELARVVERLGTAARLGDQLAATIEILIGPLLYLAVLPVLAIGTHSVYSIAMMHNAQALPTVGLSGVVMGMIALFVFFIPHARISCFLWLVFFYRRFALPAWLLATWYIGWDLYSLFKMEGNTGVNLVAHLSGAALGFGIGVLFFRQKRHWAQELVEERG